MPLPRVAVLVLLLCPLLMSTVVARERAPDALHAPTLYADVGDARIAYRRIGSGPPLLLATRFRGTIDTWDPAFLDALARHHDVIVFDFPGIGYSDGVQPDTMEAAAASIGAIADALELDRFALLGWSWGGLVAQSYLLDHPERVTQAVLLATNPPGQNAIPLQPAFLERALKPVNDLADEEVLFFEPKSALSRERAAQSRARIHARDGVDAHIPSRQDQFDRYFAAAGAFHADAAKRRERLQQLATPILVLCGDHDTSTAGQNWFPLIGSMRNAQFVFYSETGHAPQHQQPELVAEAIIRFLAARASR